MKQWKKGLAAVLAMLTAGSIAACGSSNTASSGTAPAGTGSAPAKSAYAGETVYYLNFKPEVADVYKEIAQEYEMETGVKLKVVTAASNTYEQTLKSELAKSQAPTIFQINGPVGYNNWKDYCLDLKDTDLYKHLTDKTLAVTSGSGVYGIPNCVEGYGIIYNDAIMKKYFALADKDKSVTATSADQIRNFATLKAVVEDMTKHRDELGIKGVFSSTSFSNGEDWRWQTHLLNIPLYYEWKDINATQNPAVTGYAQKEIAFRYADNYKNIFDLYLNNSVTRKTLLGGKSVDDSMAEFAMEKSAMVQNGSWAWSQISKVGGNKVRKSDIKFLPIYTGVSGEEKQGICYGTENFLSVNKKADEKLQKASVEFLNWLYTSSSGKKYVYRSDKLGFIAPFDTFSEKERPDDPLTQEVSKWMSGKDVTNVTWSFQAFPSQNFKNAVGASLLKYTQGKEDWNGVKADVVNDWKSEKEKS
ncbi:MAG: ABC transporter substrate-binding protein [Oscillospiraceae bacterium]|jgi:raffinose/stachyose/melibiose transport system substrate-binding protein|nr:ABC transporter substrate-binding protein [Oscillospiraceae bacterium]MCI1990910.1 ABC transporter substrate-binding protein [Oscillospiraceae bacterium]MCI2034407.1 ABC transporter substrate-binding protein [Oscillospiraceae bacterium]